MSSEYCSLCGQSVECPCNVEKKFLQYVEIVEEKWSNAQSVINSLLLPTHEQYFATSFFDCIAKNSVDCLRIASPQLNEHLCSRLRKSNSTNRPRKRPMRRPFTAISSQMNTKANIQNFIEFCSPYKLEFYENGQYVIDKYITTVFPSPHEIQTMQQVNICDLYVYTSTDAIIEYDGVTYSVEFKTVHYSRIKGHDHYLTNILPKKVSQWLYQLACQQYMQNIDCSLLAVILVNDENDDLPSWIGKAYFQVFEVLTKNQEDCMTNWKKWIGELSRDSLFRELCDYSNPAKNCAFKNISIVKNHLDELERKEVELFNRTQERIKQKKVS